MRHPAFLFADHLHFSDVDMDGVGDDRFFVKDPVIVQALDTALSGSIQAVPFVFLRFADVDMEAEISGVRRGAVRQRIVVDSLDRKSVV